MTSASGDNCHAEFYIKRSFNHRIQHIKITSNGSIDRSMFLSASLSGSFNEEMYCRQGSTSFLLLVFSHF